MPWGKLDDSLYDHPKLDELGTAMRMQCVGLWAVAISWCNRRLTDGHVPSTRIKLLGGTPQQAEALVRVRLFDKVQNGYQVHDFLDFNDSREYVLARRAKDAERQRLQRESKQESQRDTARTNGVTPHVSPSPARGRVPGPSSPVPPLPTHTARDEGPFTEGETDLFAFIAQHGAFIRPESGFGVRLLGLIERRGTEAVLEMARTLTAAEDSMSDRQWVFGLEKALDAIPSPPMDELMPVESADEAKSRRIYERMMAQRLEYYRNSGVWPEEWGELPAEASAA